MSNKSGTVGQTIALPKGGGALHGIGEKFSPDLHTGTGNFTVPIVLPPGRNGFQPQLTLVYSTGNGNGPFGLGWSLSVPGVTRKTSQGIPRYQGEDVFVLSGAEDLILVKKDPASSQYRPRSEGLFAHIVHHQDTTNDYWQVRSKDGLVSLYGTAGTAGHDPAVVADPLNRRKVFAWKLTQTDDPFGNRILYEYERALGEEGPHHWDQLDLKHIRYVDYTVQGETKCLVSATFFYAERPDPFSDHRAGFEVRTTKRCTRIEIRTHADQECMVCAYDLVYLDEQHDPDQPLPLNGVSLLSQITVTSTGGKHGWAWGADTPMPQSTPGLVPELTEVGAIAAGNSYSLALAPDRTVWAWGSNSTGALGDGTRDDKHTPVPVPHLSGVVAIAAGWDHSLALKMDGTVWAWGDNAYGQLGLGTTDAQLTPIQVRGLSEVVAIAAGKLYSLVLREDGTVWAWGYNGGGALGDGTGITRLTPVPVHGLSGVVSIAAGASNSLARKADGTVWAWGYNAYGGCGDGLEDSARPTVRVAPVQVTHLSGAVAIAAGAGHNLALTADGTVWAWGLNAGAPLPAPGGGQLGDGTMTNRSTPVQVVGLNGAVAIAAGGGHSLARTGDGAVWAWGVNVYGQVGDSTTTARLTPVPVEGLTDVVALAAGYWHSLALTRPVSSPSTVEEMPPLAFRYTQFEPAIRRFFPLQGRALPARSLANPDLELVDLFGNGLPDILEMNGTVRYWRNLGAGQYDQPHDMREAPAGVGLADRGVQLLDANGDGRMDLLVTTESLAGYYPLQFRGLWDRRSFQPYRLAPSFDLKDPEVHLLDLDGDGVTDAIRSGSRLECFFNDPQEGWHGTRWVERGALEAFPGVNFSDPRVKWADMSGDGLQDILLVHDGNVTYWPNLGYGNWGKRVHMRNSPRLPYGYDPRRVLLGDVDGDGLADLVYVDNAKVTLWINQSGNGWSDPLVIKGTPTVSDMDSVRLVDMLGTGIGGLLWSQDASGSWRHPMYFLDFTGGVKPYLLSEMDNHMGAVTRVAYAPSTRFYLDDEQRPETRWQTPLPFPVQVVTRVEVIDAISAGKLTTEYRYHHGYWDGAEREFRGFGMVEQLDSETFETYNRPGLHGDETPFTKVEDRKRFSPPTLTRTWFHQGPIGEEFGDWHERDLSDTYWSGDPPVLMHVETVNDFLQGIPQRRVKRDALRALRGSILRTELYALDESECADRPYTVTESLYGLREESPPAPDDDERLHIFFPHVLAQRTTQWERGAEPMTRFTFTGDYDAYGQPRSQISIAVPRGRDYRTTVPESAPAPEPYLAAHMVTVYATASDPGTYIVDRVARTTTYEIPQASPDHRRDVLTLKGLIEAHTFSSPANLIGQSLHFYDGPAFQGLPFGAIGAYGALVRTETLVLTEDILYQVYTSGETVASPPEVPPYLVPGGPAAWTAEYPQGFRDQLPPLAGYHFQDGSTATPYTRGYFVTSERRRYDFHDHPQGLGQGLVLAQRDPLERDTTIIYDTYRLLPTQVTDPAGLNTQATYDYRVLQPHEVTEPNGNRMAYVFTPLGLLERTVVMGKTGENVGDTLDAPSVQLVYNFLAFAERGQPISVRTIKRVHHVSETDVLQPERDDTLESMEYSDGFGRLLQTRTQAEDIVFGDSIFGDAGLPVEQPSNGDAVGRQRAAGDPPNVVVSGWQLYDNKGRVVEKYEPFFSIGWDYALPQEGELGQKATMFYDPRGQVIRTINPDGSEQRVIYGIPTQLDDPPLESFDTKKFSPTPWEIYTYDSNDNAGRTHHDGALAYQHHWNTPASAAVDALGRTMQTVARNGSNPATDWYTTRSTYDIRGNLLTVTDALGRVAFRHVYDLANRPLRIDSLDAGTRRSVLDAAGNVIEGRDSKGALVLRAYDLLNRPIRLWARDGAGQSLTLRERLVYGDSPDAGLTAAQATAANLLGKPYQHYDEAGLLTLTAYDFKGNLLDKRRHAVADSAILAVFNPPPPNWAVQAFRVNWEPLDATPLEAPAYPATLTYDALNRVKTMQYPQDVGGTRKTLRPHYNRAGALERVALDGTPYVERIAYNAKGQRTLIAYGNGVMTRYAYDPHTFRLVRLQSEPYRVTTQRVNFALAATGATASASSTYIETPPSAVIDGDRKGTGGLGHWSDNTPLVYPDWIQVEFAGTKAIDEIDVITAQDALFDGPGPIEPTEELTFASWGIIDFQVLYWNGADWALVPGGQVTGNNKVWRKFSLSPALTTDKIRVVVTKAGLDHHPSVLSRIVEIEAYEVGTRRNVALAGEGGQATASSAAQPWPPRMAIDGDRIVYHWKGQWPGFDYTDGWFRVDFSGTKTLDEIDLFFPQEGGQPAVDPTEHPELTSRGALTDFDVQYWNGSTWTTVPDGSVTANDKVWRTFPCAAVTTDKIQVVIKQGPITGDTPAIVEIEAYGPGPITFVPQGAPLQDLAYAYDLAGNILTIQDRTPGSGIPNTPLGQDALDRLFSYDPLYRLLSATGRECDVPPPPAPWDDVPRCTDPTRTRGSTERYGYDPVGNLAQWQHQANGASFTRDFALVPTSNRLATVTIGAMVCDYTYDANGNLIGETTSRHCEWDHSDRMRVYRTQVNGSEPSVHAHYLYDTSGQRVKKLVRKQGEQVEVTVYIDGVFEHHRLVKPSETVENNTLHVMDNQSRIALVRVGDAFPDDGAPEHPVKYHLGDHLGSSTVVIDASGAWINREEYFPYGETSFGSFAKKRYRFMGKERDEESGLYYHGARYYAPWLGRWVSCDPAGMLNRTNLYVAFRDNPMKYIDPTGLADVNGTPPTAAEMQSGPAPLTKDPIAGFTGELTASSSSDVLKSGSGNSSVPRQRPVLGLEALAQVLDFPWKKALGLLPEAIRKTGEERRAENTAIFERAGARPETAGKLAELYDENAGAVGTFVGGQLGGALGGRIIGPSPKAPYVGLKNPLSSAPKPPVPASIPRPFVNSGGTVIVEDELMARGTFEIRVLDPFRLNTEALQLGRGHVLQGVSNPRATRLSDFMKSVEAGGGKVNWMTYSLLNVEEHQGPIISHLDDVFFNTGGQGQISRAEIESILNNPVKLELTTFMFGGFKTPPSLVQLMKGGAPR